MQSNRISWAEYALRLAEVAACRSEDPYQKVGACALNIENEVVALGYNGAPPGVEIDWSDRDERRKRVCHAELACLRNCKPRQVGLLAVTLMPCTDCMKQIAMYGINKVVFREKYDKDSFGEQLAKEFNIELTQIENYDYEKDWNNYSRSGRG